MPDEAKDKQKKRMPDEAKDKQKKRVKIETVTADDELLTLPAITVVGVRSMIVGLSVMLSSMELEALHNPEYKNKYKAHMDTLRRNIDYYKGLPA